MALELKAKIEIKSLGIRLDANSTQKDLENALKHRPELKTQGIIIETKGKTNDKIEEKSSK